MTSGIDVEDLVRMAQSLSASDLTKFRRHTADLLRLIDDIDPPREDAPSLNQLAHEVNEGFDQRPTDRYGWLRREHGPEQCNVERVQQRIDEAVDVIRANEVEDGSLIGRYFDLIREQRGDHAERIIEQMRRETAEIIAMLSPMDQDGFLPRAPLNGLVLGSVQSGKSSSFIAVLAIMTDLGVRTTVVLSGATKDLRTQTEARIGTDLIDRSGDRLMSITEYGDMRRRSRNREREWALQEQLAVRHLGDRHNARVVVTKKNKSTLEATQQLLDALDGHGLLPDGVLIIDDECDHASINTVEELFDGCTSREHWSTIHRLIHEMRERHGSAYCGYTATPQANLFQHEEDALSPHRVTVLDAHRLYLGPIDVFHTHRGELVDGCEIDDLTVPVQELRGPPASLVRAIVDYALSGAIHHLDHRRSMPHGSRHAMMIHISRGIADQVHVRHLVEAGVSQVMAMLQEAMLPYPVDAVDNRLARFQRNRLALRPRRQRLDGARPHVLNRPRSEVLGQAIRVLESTEFCLLNSESQDTLDYSDPLTPDNLIVVGGDVLSRGLTIEGLRTSYFARAPATPLMDSMMQAARWFGPLRMDMDMISLHLTEELAERFAQIAYADAQLRDELRFVAEQGLPPSEARLHKHPMYRLTAKNKRYNEIGLLTTDEKISTISVCVDEDAAAQTADLMRTFLSTIEARRGHELITHGHGGLKGVRFSTTCEEARAFFQEVPMGSENDRAAILNQFEAVIQMHGPDHPCNVVLRNGSLSSQPMCEEIPGALHGLGLKRVKRGRRGRTGDELKTVAGGRTPGGDLYTSDWWIDGHRPENRTAYLRGWRRSDDPVLVVLFPVGWAEEESHLPQVPPLRLASILAFAHGGPAGGISVNSTRSTRSLRRSPQQGVEEDE